jgi:hypothetical protein
MLTLKFLCYLIQDSLKLQRGSALFINRINFSFLTERFGTGAKVGDFNQSCIFFRLFPYRIELGFEWQLNGSAMNTIYYFCGRFIVNFRNKIGPPTIMDIFKNQIHAAN